MYHIACLLEFASWVFAYRLTPYPVPSIVSELAVPELLRPSSNPRLPCHRFAARPVAPLMKVSPVPKVALC